MEAFRSKTHTTSRRWRFGLRAIFAVLTIVACGCAWIGVHAQRCRRENQAMSQLHSSEDGRSFNVLYGGLFRGSGSPEDSEAYFSASPDWMTNLLGVDVFRAVTTLQCYAPGNKFSYGTDKRGLLEITREYQSGLLDKDMSVVGELTYLRTLSLEANGITDQGLMQLEHLSNVETLNLSNTEITDGGLATLAKLPRLHDLDISRTDITDDAVGFLANCRALKTLNLELTNVTVHGVQVLRQALPACKITHRP